MTLEHASVGPVIPVSDMAASRAFYEDLLGLSGRETPGGYALAAGGGSAIYLLPADTIPGTASWPLASFRVDDLGATVAGLRERGVEFLGADRLPFDVDERGISRQDDMAVAWMLDPDGQVLTVFELG